MSGGVIERRIGESTRGEDGVPVRKTLQMLLRMRHSVLLANVTKNAYSITDDLDPHGSVGPMLSFNE